MDDPITLPDALTAFEELESGFVFKDEIKYKDSSEAKKLKRYCAFLSFYVGQAEEKFRIFDELRPDLSISMDIDNYDLLMTVWWWAYLDVIVHTSNLYDKPSRSNEPASLFYLDTKINAWSNKLGVENLPTLPIKDNDSRLKSLLDLRDKAVIHVEPKYYFNVLDRLTQSEDFFSYLINETAIPYLDEVYETFFKDPPKIRPDPTRVAKLKVLVEALSK